MSRGIGWLIAVGAMLAGGLVLWDAASTARRSREKPSGQPAPATARTPEKQRLAFDDVQLKDFDEHGNLQWRVKSSGSIDFDREKLRAVGRDIVWELGRAQGATLVVSAPAFLVDYPGKRIALSKGIRAESTEEDIAFQAQGVVYDLATERLRADGITTAHFRDFDLTAQALGFGRLSQEATFFGDVTCSFRDYVGTAGKAVVRLSERRATLTGAPQVRRGEYSARADQVVLDAAAQEARLKGNVRLEGKGMWGRASGGRFAKASQRAELSGGVWLKTKGFTATGRRLALDGRRQEGTLSGNVHVQAALQW